MKHITFIFTVAALICSCGRNIVSDIIPEPSEIHMAGGYFHLPDTLETGCPDSSFLSLDKAFKALVPDTEFRLNVSDKGGLTIRKQDGIAEGGYRMKVSRRGILIEAADYGGAVSATATLGQMVSDGRIPCCTIQDSPRFGWRGFMLDVSRHFFSKEEVMDLLETMASYKFNRFHWHLTDDQGWRIEIRKYPELTDNGAWRDPLAHNHDIICARIAESMEDPSYVLDHSKIVIRDGKDVYGGFYSQEDIREIVAYAGALGIEVVPEIDMPGHSLKVVESYPELSCGGVARWGKDFSVPLCPGNDGLLQFAKDVYSEIFSLFPFGYVHIGADEVEQTHWKTCPKCQARIKSEGLADENGLQAWFVKEMQGFFAANGKKLIGWDEIVSGGAPSEATVMWWRGWRPDTRTTAVENGHELIVSSSEFLYLGGEQDRNSLMKVYNWDPVADGLAGHEDKVLGIQAHLWAETVPTFANACNRIFPRLFAVSELAWSDPAQKDAVHFNRRVLLHLRKLEEKGMNYRIPDLSGFCDVNVFVNSVRIDVEKPFEDMTVRYTADGTIPRSSSPIYDSPLTISSNTTLHFRPYTSDGMPGDIFRAEYRKTSYMEPCTETGTATLKPGLKADWYEFRGEACDSITHVPFNGSYVTEGVYIPEEVKGNIGLVFTGYINIPEDGIYSFYTYSDDGSYIRINGEMIVDSDGPHSRMERSGQAALKKGLHAFEARYFDHSGGILEAGFIMPDGRRRLFEAGDFLHTEGHSKTSPEI